MIRRRPPVPDPAQTDSAGAAESMWTTFTAVNTWIRHLDAKAAVTLTADGVTAGLLYSVVNDGHGGDGGWWADVAAGACATALLASAVAAAVALTPRVRAPRRRASAPGTTVPNPLFFGDITRIWPDPNRYTADLEQVVRDPAAMTRHVGQQIWVNAGIAQRKATSARTALTIFLAGLALLAVLAVILTAS